MPGPPGHRRFDEPPAPMESRPLQQATLAAKGPHTEPKEAAATAGQHIPPMHMYAYAGAYADADVDADAGSTCSDFVGVASNQ